MSQANPSPQGKPRPPRFWWILLGALASVAVIFILVFYPGGLLSGASTPTITILQPAPGAELESGQGVALLAEASPGQAIQRLVLLVDGEVHQERATAGEGTVYALFHWFGSQPGSHELQVLAFDDQGQAAASASLSVLVNPPDRAALFEDATVIEAADDPAADQAQAERAAAAGLPADGGPPAEEADAEDGAGDAGAGADAGDQANEDAAEDEEQAGAAAEDGDEAEEADIIDNTPPAAELIVTVDRTPAGLVAVITANAADDVALDFMRISLSGPQGENEVFISPCDGRAVCAGNVNYVLGTSGEWVFHLQAFDLVPQASEPELTTRQILCEGAGAEANCSIVERRDPLADMLQAILEAQGDLWDDLISGEILDINDIMADFVLGEDAQPDEARDESFEVRGCLIVQPVHANNPPNPPVTECPEHNLSGEDLSGIDLRGADFERADLRQTDLSGARLAWARLFATDLRGADLTNANMARTEARLALLSGATLSGANFDSAFLSGASMQDIRSAHLHLRGAVMINTDLSNAELASANLNSANLTGANLTGANLQNATLVGANLEGANLLAANLTGVDFTDANLFRANFRPEVGQLPAGLLNAIIWNNTICPDGTNSDDNGGQCSVANLTPFTIKGCIIVLNNQYPNPPFSDCRGLDMTAADFQGRDLRGADFSDTTLTAANMREGDFRFANFTDANLLGAHTLGGSFGGATWVNTTCPDGSNSGDHNNTCEGFMFP